MRDLGKVSSEILQTAGVLVEFLEPDVLEVCAPPHVQEVLSISEFCRLGFGVEVPPDAVRITLESDWTERLNSLIDSRGRALFVSYAGDAPDIKAPDRERLLNHVLQLENATYRLQSEEVTNTRYLVLTVHYTAVSDEKRENTISICANEANGAAVDHLIEPLVEKITSNVDAADDNHSIPQSQAANAASSWDTLQVLDFAKRALPGRIRERLAPFLKGMERRMGRDMERLHQYYAELEREVVTRLADKVRNSATEQVSKEEQEKAELRRSAIEREYLAKIGDLERKFAVTVQLRPIQVLRVVLPVYRFHLELKRRKLSRQFFLDWNPLSRKLDPLPCENCFALTTPRLLCDERLHFLCSSCYSSCPGCDKQYCRVCYPASCPRCREKSP